jgi:5'-deoxynucleotidase YfbR-like HD superfamily hydrolase
LFYSVAQHACLVADVVDEHLAFPALNHDDSEAYLGDVSSKLKHASFMDGYRNLENAWTMAIEIALGLRSLTPEERRHIKVADDLVAVFERINLRYRRDFKIDDIQRAIGEQWITHSTAEEMMAIAHRLPRFMTAQDHRIARAMWVTRFSMAGVRWRGANDGLLVRVSTL